MGEKRILKKRERKFKTTEWGALYKVTGFDCEYDLYNQKDQWECKYIIAESYAEVELIVLAIDDKFLIMSIEEVTMSMQIKSSLIKKIPEYDF